MEWLSPYLTDNISKLRFLDLLIYKPSTKLPWDIKCIYYLNIHPTRKELILWDTWLSKIKILLLYYYLKLSEQ